MQTVGIGRWSGLNELIDLAKHQIGWQLEAFDSIDAKAIGLLAFDGALGAALFLAKPTASLTALRIIGMILLGLSALGALFSLWTARPDVGPEALLLGRDLVEANRGPVALKAVLWKAAAAVLALSVVVLAVALSNGG